MADDDEADQLTRANTLSYFGKYSRSALPSTPWLATYGTQPHAHGVIAYES
jgi:hypothetical protein